MVAQSAGASEDTDSSSDGVAPVMLELWEMLSTLSFPLLSGKKRSGMVAPDRILSIV